MRSNGVVVVAPLADDDLGFFQAVEDLAVQQLIAQLAVEAFAVTVLSGASRFDVEGLRAHACQPLAYDLRRHLRTVVGTDVLWDAACEHDVGHCLQNTKAVDPARNSDRQTLARELVDQRHQPNFAAIVGLGFDEVVGPDMIAPLRSQPDAGAVVEP